MAFDFDTCPERRDTGSSKWSKFAPDVLPMWVADMDFAAAPEIVTAITERLKHPVFGYCVARDDLRHQITADMKAHYGWQIEPDDIVFLPGVEPGFNMAVHAFTEPGQTLAIQTPIYRPILNTPKFWKLETAFFNLEKTVSEQADILARADATLLCNPHNPTGKVYRQDDLLALAEATGDTPLISDEVHCEIVFSGQKHIPLASLSEDIARRTITLMSAGKTYNLAGLKTAFAIVQNPALRERFNNARLGMVDSVNALGLEATLAAFRDAGPWKLQLLAYLEQNRDYLAGEISRRFPGISMSPPEASFLAWLDCSKLGLEDPQQFFLEKARVGLSAGSDFGAQYGQFVRLNFGCPRTTLTQALDRMETALKNFR